MAAQLAGVKDVVTAELRVAARAALMEMQMACEKAAELAALMAALSDGQMAEMRAASTADQTVAWLGRLKI